jgi:hypothetical protein
LRETFAFLRYDFEDLREYIRLALAQSSVIDSRLQLQNPRGAGNLDEKKLELIECQWQLQEFANALHREDAKLVELIGLV